MHAGVHIGLHVANEATSSVASYNIIVNYLYLRSYVIRIHSQLYQSPVQFCALTTDDVVQSRFRMPGVLIILNLIRPTAIVYPTSIILLVR